MKKSKNNFPADLQVYGVIIMSDKSNILNFNYSMYKNRITDVKLVWWLKFNSKKNVELLVFTVDLIMLILRTLLFEL